MPLKLLLKRGALVAAANWQVILIQFAAQTTFQVLLAMPIIGAAILVALLLGGDLGNLLQGSLREIFASIANALMAEPVALTWFLAAFALVLLAGSALMFLVKGGTATVMLAGNDAGPIERMPLSMSNLRQAAHFRPELFVRGCELQFGRFAVLGFALMVAYGVFGSV